MFVDDLDTPQYQVVGSERLIDDPTPTPQLRPLLTEGELSSLTPVGREFEKFDQAAYYFSAVIGIILS